nr:hypothetical protein [Tanacetum cinerariifolium]
MDVEYDLLSSGISSLQQGELSSLAVGTSYGSGNSSLTQFELNSPLKMVTELQKMYGKPPGIKRNKQPIVGAFFTPQVMAIQGGRVHKYKPQGKAKGKGKGKEEGHWKRNSPVYLVELMKKKKKTGGQNVASTSSSIYTIELFVFPKNSWVYDTGCGTHICNTKHGLRGAKKLKRGSLYLYVGNGVHEEVEAIGSLDNCHYAPSITRGVVSVSCLVDKGFTQYYQKACGIVQQLTPPYTPQYNGVSERRNRTLLNMVRSMMSLATLPLSFWDYALESVARILNMVWGCEAHVKRHTPNKLQQRSIKCIFVGYPKETIESGRIVELEDEDILPSENTSEHPIEEESLALIVSQEEDIILVHRSVRTHKAPDRLCLNVEIDPDQLCFNVEVEEHSLGDLNETDNYKATLSDLEFEKWLVAINAEMQSMYDNKVWRLVVLPPNAKLVKNKWIYKKKMNMDGKVHIYKARLVAKGCTQTYGVDYKETFSPVADIRAIRILIAIATYYDYEI